MFHSIYLGTMVKYMFWLHSSIQGFKEKPMTSFTQEDLNQRSIMYQQQATGIINDSIVLEATNGMTKVGPITVVIDIIPILLPLQV